jgi:pimeloyl-ACP methyl ester carboxylesterase
MHRSVLASALALLVSTAAAQQKVPTAAEADVLVARFLALDDKTRDGHIDRTTILAQLAALPPLDAPQLVAWQGKIQKLWSKGRKLEKAGDNWYWPADKKLKTQPRGRYIVGGETKKPKGLAINMHGGGAGSGDAGSAAGAYESALAKFGLLMIAPEVLEKTEHGWTDSGTEEFVLDLVDAALRTWKLDPDRVYFVGHSMGGYGSWTLGGHHADRVAAIAPSAGAPTPIRTREGGPVVDIAEGVIPSLRNVYVSIYQSTDDVQVPPEPNQVAARLLGEAAKKWGGFAHKYWEVHDRGHAGPPGGYEAMLDEAVQRSRQAVPERLVWQPVLPWKRQFHWLWWAAPVANALVVADLDKKANTATITCDKPTDGLHVLVDARVCDPAREFVVTVNGVETFRGKPVPHLTTLLRTSDHPDPKLQFAAQVPAFAKKE